MIERQKTLATSHPKVPAWQIFIATGLEGCDGSPPANSVPLSSGPPDLWAVTYEEFAPSVDTDYARAVLATARGPLTAVVNFESQPGAPARDRGAGLPQFTLIPQLEVVSLLGLRPETPALRHVLIDDNGPALVGRQWRRFLVHDGNYLPLEPAVCGADLLLRPDLYKILENAVGTDRLFVGLAVRHSEHESLPAAEQ